MQPIGAERESIFPAKLSQQVQGKDPTGKGKDQTSEKPIAPLAPAANAKRFTEPGRVDNYFRLNCKDVVGRECSAQEKADVLAWLISLKP